MISVPNCFASAIAIAVLPTAVGPATTYNVFCGWSGKGLLLIGLLWLMTIQTLLRLFLQPGFRYPLPRLRRLRCQSLLPFLLPQGHTSPLFPLSYQGSL